MAIERYSDSYLGTFHYESAGEMMELQKLRDYVSVLNKKAKMSNLKNMYGQPLRYYLKCQGRGPREHEGKKYHQALPLKYATHVDAYIYLRYSW